MRVEVLVAVSIKDTDFWDVTRTSIAELIVVPLDMLVSVH
jgi:hypothetical protein